MEWKQIFKYYPPNWIDHKLLRPIEMKLHEYIERGVSNEKTAHRLKVGVAGARYAVRIGTSLALFSGIGEVIGFLDVGVFSGIAEVTEAATNTTEASIGLDLVQPADTSSLDDAVIFVVDDSLSSFDPEDIPETKTTGVSESKNAGIEVEKKKFWESGAVIGGAMITGDIFNNVHNSIIATRRSIASGIIKVKENGDDRLADALHKLDEAIIKADIRLLPDEQKKDALELTNRLIEEATSPNKSKAILKSLGTGIWEIIKNVKPIMEAIASVWPFIQKLWT